MKMVKQVLIEFLILCIDIDFYPVVIKPNNGVDVDTIRCLQALANPIGRHRGNLYEEAIVFLAILDEIGPEFLTHLVSGRSIATVIGGRLTAVVFFGK